MNPASAIGGALLALGHLGLVAQFVNSAQAVTNEWTRPASGSWEEPYWSLGQLPARDQDLVAFRNPGWKALAIGVNTTANYPDSLSLKNLTIDGPADSYNQLLLNWAGRSVPLSVASNLIIGTNGSLMSHSSALQAAQTWLSGSATFADAATASLAQVTLDSGATLTLNEAFLSCSNLTFLSGTFTQTGGTHLVQTMVLPGPPLVPYVPASGRYLQQGGALRSVDLTSGPASVFEYGRNGTFEQSGGAHTNANLTIRGWIEPRREGLIVHPVGQYQLSAGWLSSDALGIAAGQFIQNGGTNYVKDLSLQSGGTFALHGGELVTSNTSLLQSGSARESFAQTGGAHLVAGSLRLEDASYYLHYLEYSLSGGSLSTANLEIGPGTTFKFFGGTLANYGVFRIHGGSVWAGAVSSRQLGKLQIADATLYLHSDNSSGPTVLQFQDSHDTAWSGRLQILNWHPAQDHLFIGTNPQGLTPAQLNQITFVQPIGWPNGWSAAAMLLPTGEVVPPASGEAGGFTYRTTNGLAIITGYAGPDRSITIPGTIAGLPVVEIGNHAFENAGGLTNAIVSDSVTRISDYAFAGCSNLLSITIPPSVTTIGDDAFLSCQKLASLTLPNSITNLGSYACLFCTNLSQVSLSSNLTAISFGTFEWCSALPDITIPNSVTAIGTFAFGFCTNLTSITIPESVTTIGDLAFSSCTSLSRATIPGSVTNIGFNTFDYCLSLSSIVVNPLNPVYSTLDGVLFDKSRSTLIKYPAGKAGNYTVPDGVNSIYNWAFEYSSDLTSVTVPHSVTEIDYTTFASCPNLRGIYFQGDAPRVGDDAFSYSTNVVVYYLPGTTGWGTVFAGRPTAFWSLAHPVILAFGPSFGVRTNGFGFRISWATNAVVVVEAHMNLTSGNWFPVSTNSLVAGSADYSDSQWRAFPARYYRVRAR